MCTLSYRIFILCYRVKHRWTKPTVLCWNVNTKNRKNSWHKIIHHKILVNHTVVFGEAKEIVPCSINNWSLDIIRCDLTKPFFQSKYTCAWLYQILCIFIFFLKRTCVWIFLLIPTNSLCHRWTIFGKNLELIFC